MAVYENKFNDSEWTRFLPEGHAPLENVLFAPLLLEGKAAGLIGLANKPGGFNEHDAGMVSAFSEIAAIALSKNRALEALQESEERFRTLVENAPEGFYVISAGGILASLNPAFKDITGWHRDEWIGRHFSELIHPDDLPVAKKWFQHVLQGNKTPLHELRVLSKSGEYIIAEFISAPFIKNGKIAGVAGITRNITERKKAAQAISDSEERYRQLFEGSGDAVVVHPILNDGSPGNFIEVNQVACKRLGYTREELLKLSPAVIDAPEMSSQRNKVITDIMAKKHIVFEMVHVAKDGRKIPVEINANFFNLKGQAMILSVVRDSTERKQLEDELRDSEKKYRRLFENTSNGIVIFDSETLRFEDVNMACSNLYGYSKEEFLSLSPLDMSAEAEKSRIAIQKGLDSELTHIPLRYHKKKDGTVFPVEIFAGAFFHKGRKKGIGVIVDLTERMRSEEELKLAYKEAEEKSGKLERFNKLMVNRELEMIKLKKEVNELLEKTGQQRRYETPERIKKAEA